MNELKNYAFIRFRFFLFVLAFIGGLSKFDVHSQVVSPFAIRNQIQQKGGIRFVSNVSVTCNSSTNCTTAQNQVPPSGTGQNNNFTMGYVDVDGDPSTFMSSSDSLNLANCSEITWAGLYWGGKITTSTSNYANRSNIKIKVGNGSYQQLTADQTLNNSTGAVTYFCFKDITSIVQSAGIKAKFTVADQINQTNSTNLFGGWSIVVVYKNTAESYKNLTVFDGLANVSQGTASNTVTIPISGFLTPLSGGVNFELGVIAYDGDRSQTGDQLLFNGVGTNYVQVSDGLHSATDMFNSTIAYNGVITPFRNPSYNNTLGYDATVYIPNNTAQNYLNNGATSANIRVTTSSETILTRVITSAIDIYEPDLRATVYVNDLNGGVVSPGDILEYTVIGKNIGSDISLNTFITDTLDIRTSYVPNSISFLNGPFTGSKTDVAGDDQAEYDAANRVIKTRVGTGATALVGGQMVNSPTGIDSTAIRFQVQVSSDCLILSCDSTLENKAYIFGTGNLSGNLVTNNGTSDVYDAFGCPTSSNNEVTISTASCPPVDFTVNDPLCPGDTLQLTAAYSQWANYFWTGPQGFTSTIHNPTVQNIGLLNSGVYELDISFNGSACTFNNLTNSIIVNPSPTISLIDLNHVTCYNASNGSIQTSVQGASPITYLWSNSNTTNSVSGLAPGSYNIEVQDGNTCISDTTFAITQPDTLIATTISLIDYNGYDISCFNYSNGSIQVTATGGTQPYTYLWSNGQTSSVLTGLVAGVYSVTVTDANGCSAVSSITLTQPAQIQITSTVQNVLCFGGNNGSVNANITGGVFPYSILWSNGPVNQTINNLVAGQYQITVSDINGCTDSLESSVLQPAQPLSCSHTQVDVLCYGEATGLIDLTVNGGTPGYQFSWSIAQSTEDLSNLPTGFYSVTVTDANNCTVAYGATIQQPTAPLSFSGLVTPIGCYGDTTGAVNIAVSGGTPSYTYVWNNGQTTQNINTLIAGNYAVQITDNHNCLLNGNFVVTQPQAPITLSEVHQDAGCFGPGSIDLTTSGGTAPYSFFWDNLVFVEDQLTVPAGTYEVQVQDGNGCSDSLTVTVLNLAVPIYVSVSGQNILCQFDSTGTTDLVVTGGVQPFSYAWSNGSTLEDLTQVPAGTYSVIVTDANNCTESVSITLTEPSSSTVITEMHTNANCLDSVAGAINISVSGGTPGYTYSWNNGATTQDISSLQNGNYEVSVFDANGCIETLLIPILDPSNTVAVSSVVSNVNCFGGADGNINLTPSGGFPGYVFEWGTGAVEEDVTNLAPGPYYVNVEDVLGCGMFLSFNVTQPALPLTISGTVYDVVCLGDTNGIIDLTITGGTPTYSYVWNNGATTQDIFDLTAGTYSVIVSDANGCSSTYSGIVTQPGSAISMTLYPSPALCFGTATGSIDLNVSGGVPGYTFSWSNGSTTEDLTSIQGGQYSVTIQDLNGCLLADTVVVSQPMSALTLNQTTTNVSCTGLSDGYINLMVSGGTGPYVYLWNNGSTTQDLSNVPAGIYTVTVTDANSCTGSLTIQVTQPSALVGVTGVSANVICHGGTTGSVAATGTGGTGIYTYLWSNGSTSATLTGIPAGIYSVIVTDNNGCNSSQAWTITEPSPISLQSVNTNILCYGQSSGSISAQASGGVAPYQYQWTNGLTGSVIVNQVAGPYFVTVIDDNGCTSTFSDTIYQPQSALTMSSIVVDNTCFGVNGGSINNTTSGGTAPYQYQWNTGASTEDLTNLLAGSYTVTILDANGCIYTSTQSVSQPPVSMTASETHLDVSCYGGGNGLINLTVSGTGFPFSYAWSNGETTQDIDSLVPGVYNVTITDDDGCILTQSVNISQPSTAINVQALVTDVLCHGNPTGSIDVTVTGGVGPYSYNWTNGPGSQDLVNVIAGNYQLTVSDQVGCTYVLNASILQPSSGLAIQLNPTQIACNGFPTGQIDLQVSGGTLGYSYVWNNGSSSQDIFGLSPGAYVVTVTDGNGCTTSGTTVLSQPSLPMTVTGVIGSVLCYGDSTGFVNITASGGTAPYNYLWNGTIISEDIDSIPAGPYVLEVYDDNGCYVQQTYQVQQSLSPLTLTSVQTPAGCYGGSNGQLNLTVTGGTTPYSYQWNTGSTVQDLQNLSTGIYSVTVTDANGCSGTLQDTVTQPSFYGVTAQVTPVACFGQNTGSIDATVIGGTGPYTYSWSNTQTTQDLSGLLAGTYLVSVTDQNGCLSSQSFSVTQPSATLSLSTVMTNVSCTGSGTGGIDLTVTGGTAPYTYIWNNQATTQDISNVAQGTYTVTVTDAGGCQVSTGAQVTQPQAMSLIVSTSNPLCPGTATGSIDLTVNGGTQPYGYAWSGPNTTATTQDIGFLTAGVYFVTVTDANNCTSTQSVSLQNPIGVSATYVSTPVQCYGGNNGSVNVSVTGGAAPYSYQWNTGAQTQDIWNVPAGNDTLVITDALGCVDTLVTLTTQPIQPITVTAAIQNVGCFNNQTGTIDLSVIGGTPGYMYQWSNASTSEDLVNYNPGIYSVQIYDANGCFTTDTFQINQLGSQMYLAITGSNVTCFGSNDGTVDLTITGGITPYLITWNNGETTEDLDSLLSGLYSVSVQDNNGCTMSTSITITAPTLPLVATVNQTNLLCYNQNTGALDLTVTGGAAPYFYTWSNGSTNQDLTNLAAGGYTVSITDFNGCTITASYYVTQPSSEAVISSTVNNILCNGNSTGWINATAVGGALPYSYFWQGPSGFVSPNEDLFGIPAGSYVLMVTDGIGCVTQDTIVVSQPALITPTVIQTNVSCYGFGNGSLDISVTGGVGSYDYSWSTGATTQDLTNLIPATYTLTITDDNNCSVGSSYVITQPLQALTSSISQVNVSCYGDSTGFINLNVTGGTLGYTYSWTNGSTTEDIFNLPIGTYGVNVTDANGCTTTSQTTITQPQAGLSISSSQTNVSCYGGSNGSISIFSQGGTPSYDYLWNNGQTTSTISGLPIGSYTVLVTDSLNCSDTLSLIITQPQEALSSTSNIVDLSCLNTSTGSIDLSMNGGTPGYSYLWSNGATTQDIDSLSSGDYTVTVTDTLGCVLTTTLTVADPVDPMLVTPTVTNVTCYGGSDALISLAITGGLPSYDIQWSTGDTLGVLDSLIAGGYSVLVTDAQGCESTLNFTITQPAPIIAYFNPSVTFGCSPLSVTFTNNSSGPYTNSLWDFGNATSTTTQNGVTTFTQPGCYDISLIVSNAAGCADTMSTDSLVCVVSGPDASFVASTQGIDYYTGQLELFNTSDGAVTDYHWTFGDGSPNSTMENPIHYYPDQQAGSYLVTLSIIDTNGCVDTASYEFSLVEILSVYIPNSITINGDNINELFLPVFSNVDIMKGYQMEIYNRWGQLVWETDIVSEGWNGRYKDNKDVQLGTYTWKIKYTDNLSVSRIIVGHVTILR